ncbi:hypothetical protein BDP27DRAFT_1371236 [Rhodocollybia butyracea]|uniref:Uncharacterized protein n=1 Tax=Rhodocollybia butyracea TaxID=206335 RepID=A0A9P5TYX4_9AGAR|nr:hypothetical protein BDP27DRAFT_1371236 [Rhodocollybia butyracea]
MSFVASVLLPKVIALVDKAEQLVLSIKNVVNDLPFYSWTTPPDEIPDILSLRVSDLDTVLVCEIPTLKAVLQKKPIPPRNAYEGPGTVIVPQSGLIRQVEPNTCSSMIQVLLERLEPLSPRLQHWPLQDEVLAKVLVDMEGILLEMVPKLRATVTSRELSTAEIFYLQGNNEHPSSPTISACDDEDEEIVDMTPVFEGVLDWLQAEERDEMLPVPSLQFTIKQVPIISRTATPANTVPILPKIILVLAVLEILGYNWATFGDFSTLLPFRLSLLLTVLQYVVPEIHREAQNGPIANDDTNDKYQLMLVDSSLTPDGKSSVYLFQHDHTRQCTHSLKSVALFDDGEAVERPRPTKEPVVVKLSAPATGPANHGDRMDSMEEEQGESNDGEPPLEDVSDDEGPPPLEEVSDEEDSAN